MLPLGYPSQAECGVRRGSKNYFEVIAFSATAKVGRWADDAFALSKG
jgi:hypothetical protein